MFDGAKPLSQYFEDGKKSGKTYLQLQQKIHVVKYIMQEHGDWTLYRDDKGNLWEQYEPICD